MSDPDGQHREAASMFSVPCIGCGTELYDADAKVAAMPGKREEPINDLDARMAEKDLKLIRICSRCQKKKKFGGTEE